MAYKTHPVSPSRACLRGALSLILTLLATSMFLDFLVPSLLHSPGDRAQAPEDTSFPSATKSRPDLRPSRGHSASQGRSLSLALQRLLGLSTGDPQPSRNPLHLPVPRPTPGPSSQGTDKGGGQSQKEVQGESEQKRKSNGGLLGGGIKRGSVLWRTAAAGGAKSLLQGFDFRELLPEKVRSFLGLQRKFKFEEWPALACEPDSLQEVAANLSALHHNYRRGDPAVLFEYPIPKAIHQTHGNSQGPFDEMSSNTWESMHPQYEHVVWSDASARAFVARCIPEALGVYDAAPGGILRSDMLRYLVLFVFGGIWGDADTHPLRRYGSWLDGVEGSPELKNVTLIAAVEEDDGDWERKRFVRRVQIVQWAMAAAPRHPAVRFVVQQMLRDVVALVQQVYPPQESNATNSSSSRRRPVGRKGLWHGPWGAGKSKDEEEGVFHLGPIGPFKLPPPGAQLNRSITKKDILQTTGPGAWTDGISWGLKERGGKVEDLVKMEKGKVFGDMVILPITAFSPGVGQGKPDHDGEARVKHWFAGTWKRGVQDE